jgi:hypothetical protein
MEPTFRGKMKEDITRRIARLGLTAASVAIAVGYASAFKAGGAPAWAPWLLAFGIPIALVSVMVMGAARDTSGIKKLALPFLFVGVLLTLGFCLALALPANESAGSSLLLGLPLRAAIVIYGVGLIPIVVLPVAYALTFETQTLNQEDLDKVRLLGAAYKRMQDERIEH